MRPMGPGGFNQRPSPYDRGDRFGGMNRYNSMGRGSRSFKGEFVVFGVAFVNQLPSCYYNIRGEAVIQCFFFKCMCYKLACGIAKWQLYLKEAHCCGCRPVLFLFTMQKRKML
jgi:hypothetical protein